jgi:chemotaxis protein methyltransferase CheR
MTPVSITRDELSVWSRYIHEICGVFLDHSKGYLLETRLAGLLRDTGTGGFAELFYKAKADPTNTLRRKIIDAITTNETSFFRDTAPFELLQHKLIPELLDRRRKLARARCRFASGAPPVPPGRRPTPRALS